MLRRVFRAAAVVEAFTWAGLLVSMLVKYPLAGSPIGVTVFGWLHGTMWVVFVIVCVTVGIWFQWEWWVVLLGLAASVVPLLTLVLDIWIERSGRVAVRNRTHRRRTP
ncbi:MAG: DUF3817 domain-containing protein [Desertimonas sp.]